MEVTLNLEDLESRTGSKLKYKERKLNNNLFSFCRSAEKFSKNSFACQSIIQYGAEDLEMEKVRLSRDVGVSHLMHPLFALTIISVAALVCSLEPHLQPV